jgi:salicylate hydroxylase
VTATFTNGETVQGYFLVGCDGLKAASRINLLKSRPDALAPPAFTGLAQTSGISKADGGITEASLRNWFGGGVHFITYPVSPTHLPWAITTPQKDESPESWRLYKGDDMKELQEGLLRAVEGFEPQAIKLVQTAERLLKFGIFDRKELQPEEWYSKRCVLVGDAAHPTSPHLGQGANQAMEDCYHLSQALGDLKRDRDTIEQADLQSIFAKFAEKRQPRTSALVRGARAAGEKRVVTTGKANCEARDQRVIAEWKDTAAIEASFDALCSEPQL